MTVMISAARVLSGQDDLGPGWVEVHGGTIAGLGPGDPPRPADLTLPAGTLAPGLVDAQVNGAFGIDLAAADEAGWRVVAHRLPESGVTAFVPTVITAPVAELAAGLRAFAALRPALDRLPGAAHALGVHVEGPFLSARRRGAHRLDLLADPRPDDLDALLRAGSGGILLYLTLAPERSGALEAIRTLVAGGVRVAIGHSDAREDVVHAAADAGASIVTHLYNAQRPMHHRDPGVVGAALTDARFRCGLIVDGHHVAAAAVRVAFACAPGRIMLVTDAVAALGMPPGTYRLGAEQITVSADQPPRRADGTIAGASGRLDDAIGLAVAAGVPLQAAVEAATSVPARALGRTDIGRLVPGAPADLVWLAPVAGRTLRARATWVAGRLAHGDRAELGPGADRMTGPDPVAGTAPAR